MIHPYSQKDQLQIFPETIRNLPTSEVVGLCEGLAQRSLNKSRQIFRPGRCLNQYSPVCSKVHESLKEAAFGLLNDSHSLYQRRRAAFLSIILLDNVLISPAWRMPSHQLLHVPVPNTFIEIESTISLNEFYTHKFID